MRESEQWKENESNVIYTVADTAETDSIHIELHWKEKKKEMLAN